MVDFVDRADAGQQLARLMSTQELQPNTVVMPIHERASAIAQAVAGALNLRVVTVVEEVSAGEHVIVCDDGVQTGRAALECAQRLRHMGAASMVLAVPVCPREIEPVLRGAYEQIFAVVHSLARRSLSWHYANL